MVAGDRERSLDVIIERLVLDGFDSAGADAMAEDLRLSVQRVLADGLPPASPGLDGGLPADRALDVSVDSSGRDLGQAAGAALGAAIVEAIGR